MEIIEFFKSQLAAKANCTRRALDRVPKENDDWKPHEKSMPLGAGLWIQTLAVVVAVLAEIVAVLQNYWGRAAISVQGCS